MDRPLAVRRATLDGIGSIVLDRPDAMNAVTVDLARELEAAVRELDADPAVRVITIRGAGGNFCAGGDFHEVQRLRAGGPEALAPLFVHFAAALDAIERAQRPVVAVVEGVAMAGGFELLQACDVVLVRDDARLSDRHIAFGQVPGGGGSQRLPRLVGRQRALGHLLGGEPLSGAEAVAWGLAFRALPEVTFEAESTAFVRRLADRDPAATTTIKRLVRDGLAHGLEIGLGMELAAVLDHIGGEAGAAGFAAFSSGAGRTA